MVAAVLLLAACAGTPDPQTHVVRRGDTLYSIARSHGMNYRDLAAANNLNYPYTLEVGQRLRIPIANPGHHVVQKGDTLYSIAWRYGLDYHRLAAANGIAPPYTIYLGQRLRLAEGSVSPAPRTGSTGSGAGAKPAPTARPPAGKPAPPPPPAMPANRDPWRWPATGKLLETFSTSGAVNKGIDIAGTRGQSVLATRSGKVVYAGTGIAGYGNLIIVKHDETWLSAYAHSDRMLVREGDTVKSGQKIAEMGDTGTSRVMLHFEIRRDGKPVDPLGLLPKR